MTHPSTGAWVYFRVQIIPALSGTFPISVKPGDPMPNPFFTVTESSFPVRDLRDIGARSNSDALEQERTIAAYVVRIELAPAPPRELEAAVINELRRKLCSTVLRNAGAIADTIFAGLSSMSNRSPSGTSPSFDFDGLARSIQIVLDADRLGVAVGSPLDGIRFLECGTEDMPDRPLLLCALEGQKRRILSDVEERARKIFGLATGTFGATDAMGFTILTGDPHVDGLALWSRWYDQESRNNFDALCDPPIPVQDLSDRIRQIARDYLRAVEKVLGEFSEAIQGPPDPPTSGPPPPTGKAPVGDRPKKQPP